MIELDEDTRRLVDGSSHPPYLYAIGPDDARLALAEMQAPPSARADVLPRVTSVVTRHGPIRATVLVPAAPDFPPPVVLYAHGGGWLVGGYETHHRLATAMCQGAGAVVVVPEYARTPEARFPVAVEQLTDVLSWIRAGGLPVAADQGQIAVAGDCAGATMALAIALGDRGAGQPLAGQILLYPLGRPGDDDPSVAEFATGAALRLDDVRRLYRAYSPHDPRADPLAEVDVRGLPPTLLVTAEADVTRDHAERFGARLRAAGVPITATRYLGVVHDFAVLDAVRWTPSARTVTAQVTAHLRAGFGPPRAL